MPENSDDFPPFPEVNPNAETRDFDAFTPTTPGVEGVGGGSGDGFGSGGGQPNPAGNPEYFAYPPTFDPAAAAPARSSRFRNRTIAIIIGAVLVVGGVSAGAYAAFASSSPSQPSAASTVPSGSPTKGKHAKVQTVRITVVSYSGSTLTGTNAAGVTITVNITAKTKYGTTARPFTQSQIVPGAVIVARGQRTGTTTITANIIAGAATSAATPGATPTATTPAA